MSADLSTVHNYNPAVPYFNGSVAEAVAVGAFPIHMSTAQIFQLASAFEGVFGPAMVAFQKLMATYLPYPTAVAKQWAAENTHPLAREMPLMDPVDVLFCLVAYFVFLAFFFFVGRLTGKLELRGFGIVHNLFLAVASLYMGVGLLYDVLVLHKGKMWNNAIDASHPISLTLRNMAWLFTASKLYEYVDTFIMVLKHNYRQVSFLHVYHHCSVFVVCYVYFAYSPGSDVAWSGIVNGLIHVVMYIYYLLNLIFRTGPVKEFVQRNKFIITRCQITQFVLNMVQAIYILFIAPKANCRKEPMWLSFFYMITMITLFYNFMVQNQKLAAKKKKEAALKAKKTA